MIHVTLAISEFVALLLGTLLAAAASIGAAALVGGGLLWGAWRAVRRLRA